MGVGSIAKTVACDAGGGATAGDLTKHTLTERYNKRPACLAHAHAALDTSVAAACCWPAAIAEEEVVPRLPFLKGERVPA